MWVMTTRGMVSIVADEVTGHGTLQARARERRALEYLLPGHRVVETVRADYRFRCVGLQPRTVARMLELAVHEIDYHNFKSAAAKAAESDGGHAYVERLHRAWHAMGGDTMAYGGDREPAGTLEEPVEAKRTKLQRARGSAKTAKSKRVADKKRRA